MNLILCFIKSLKKHLFIKNRYSTVYISELPDSIKEGKIYILGEGESLWEAVLLCPCGCTEILHMSLHKEGRPKWIVKGVGKKYITLTPSIWRKNGCRSHFFFKNGCIEWCKDSISNKI
ncbi:MAG: DUF6527 family protein [Bacillota bacterium]|nr:DUF6527 family protein [Bacillota bacterium]